MNISTVFPHVRFKYTGVRKRFHIRDHRWINAPHGATQQSFWKLYSCRWCSGNDADLSKQKPIYLSRWSQIHSFTNKRAPWTKASVTEREDEAGVIVYFPPASLMCVFTSCYIESMLSRYAYDVNITLHILPLNAFGVCSFITLAVVMKQNEWNRLNLPFADWIHCTLWGLCSPVWLVVNNRLMSPNVPNICNWVKKKASETLRKSSACLLCAVCSDYTRLRADSGWMLQTQTHLTWIIDAHWLLWCGAGLGSFSHNVSV